MYCISTLFFSYQLIRFTIETTVYYMDKSLRNNINTREMIVRTWLLVPCVVAFVYTIFIIKRFANLKVPGYVLNNNYWMVIGFSIGLTFMITIFAITTKVKKDKRLINVPSSYHGKQETKKESFTSSRETRESNSYDCSYNSFTTYNNIITNILNKIVFNITTNDNKYYSIYSYKKTYKKENQKPLDIKDFDLQNQNKEDNYSHKNPSKKERQFVYSAPLTNKKIEEMYHNAIELNYFDCKLSVFSAFLHQEEPVEKIVWKAKADNGRKNRQTLLTYLDDLFPKQLRKKSRKEIISIVTKYFEFNEDGHLFDEKDLSGKIIGEWMKDN